MEAFPEMLETVRQKIQEITGYEFSYANLNYYANGRDYISIHSDNELAEGDIVASISLGATRRFVMYEYDKESNTRRKLTHQVKLNHGDLFIMDYNSGNARYQHALPSVTKFDFYTNGVYGEPYKGRININFRVK